MKAVLFDFWGTLAENGCYSPLKQTYLLLRQTIPFGDFVATFEKAAMTTEFKEQKEAFEEACKALGAKYDDELIDRLVGLWNKNKILAKPYPETATVLNNLKKKGIKLALVSNSLMSNTDFVLEKYQLDQYFDKIMLSCKYGLLKNNGLITEALKELKVNKDEAIMVGDSIESDIEPAEQEGVKALLVDRRDNREYPNKIKTLDEIEKQI